MKQGRNNTGTEKTAVAEVESSLHSERTPLASSSSKGSGPAPVFQTRLAHDRPVRDMVPHTVTLPLFRLKFPSGTKLLPVQQINSRVGVPSNRLAANCVLSSETLEIHLNPETQTSGADPCRMFHQERGYARGFSKLPECLQLEKRMEPLILNHLHPSFRLEVGELEQNLNAAGMIQ